MSSGIRSSFAAPSPATPRRSTTPFLGSKAIAGTLQLPYASVEPWRKRIADFAPEDYFLVASIAGEGVGKAGLHASKSARRRHVGDAYQVARLHPELESNEGGE
jgi:hypothetical protein